MPTVNTILCSPLARLDSVRLLVRERKTTHLPPGALEAWPHAAARLMISEAHEGRLRDERCTKAPPHADMPRGAPAGGALPISSLRVGRSAGSPVMLRVQPGRRPSGPALPSPGNSSLCTASTCALESRGWIRLEGLQEATTESALKDRRSLLTSLHLRPRPLE